MRDQLLALISRSYGTLDRRRQMFILTYHRVGDQSHIGADQVRKQLTYLARKYQTTTPSQLHTTMGSRRIAVVTIDDCHQDTYRFIFPEARELGIPITICVPTDFFFRNRWLWFDKVTWGLSRAAERSELTVENRRLVVRSKESVDGFLEYLKKEAPQQRDSVIDQVLLELGVEMPEAPADGFRPVSKENMREMLETGLIEICSHTVSHPILTRISDEQLRTELVQSKRELEEFCGKEVVSFCYPNGHAGDFDERTRRAIQAAGYLMAFTMVEGLNRPGSMDLLELRRMHAHPRYSVFLKRASGLEEIQNRLRHAWPGRGATRCQDQTRNSRFKNGARI